VYPIQMLAAGLPFIKKSLLGKHASFADPKIIKETLRSLGHPNNT